jgi:hypothetical protein
MKTSKKAILGMLVAIVMSLGVMGRIDSKKEVPDMNLIWGVGSVLATSEAENTTSGSIMLNCYGALISAGYGALYGSLYGPGVGTVVGLAIGL